MDMIFMHLIHVLSRIVCIFLAILGFYSFIVFGCGYKPKRTKNKTKE